MGLHCISSKSSPVIPSTSQRIRSYIKLLLRNKPLQNFSHMVQKASPSLHSADLKAEEKIQINCHCPSCKAREWQPWSLIPFFLPPFFLLCTCVSLCLCLSLSSCHRERFETERNSPRFAKLRNWHHGLSAQLLNVKS